MIIDVILITSRKLIYDLQTCKLRIFVVVEQMYKTLSNFVTDMDVL
jgi:hypothetical protein